MSTEPNSVPMNEEALANISGGYNVLDGLTRIGHSVADDFAKGGKLGKDAIGVAVPGAVIGAMVGAFNGLRNEIGTGVNEAVGGIKVLLK